MAVSSIMPYGPKYAYYGFLRKHKSKCSNLTKELKRFIYVAKSSVRKRFVIQNPLYFWPISFINQKCLALEMCTKHYQIFVVASDCLPT